MKSFIHRVSLICCSVGLLLSVGSTTGVAFAQDTCFGLKPDDCALATASSTPDAYGKLTSFTFNFTTMFSGISGMGKAGSVTIAGNGSYAGDKPLFVLPTNATPAATEPPIGNITLDDTITVTTQAGSKPASYEIRVVNGTVYIQFAGQWFSTTLDKARNSAIRYLALVGDPLEAVNSLKATFDALAGGGIVSAERSADLTIDTQPIAALVYHFDLPKAASAGNLGTIIGIFGTRLSLLGKMTTDQINAHKDQWANALRNTQLTVTRYVGTTDKLPHGISVDLAANIDPKDMAGLMSVTGSGASSAATPSGPISYNYHTELKLSGIGNPVTVPVPANAKQFPGL